LPKLSQEAEKLYAAADTAADGCLQFMTIHKSKGLEFDTVILPGLHRNSRGDDNPLVLWEEVPLAHGRTELAAAPMIPRDRKTDSPAAFDYLRLMEKERAENEDARVLYVAATRAIRSLHLVGVARSDSKSGEARVAANTPLGLLWPTVAASFAEASTSPCEQAADNASFTPDLIRRKHLDTSSLFAMRPATASQTVVFESEHDTTSHRMEADLGTLAHRYVELITQTGLQDWNAHRINKLRPAMARWLQQNGHTATDAQRGADFVASALNTTLASDSGRWIFASRPQAGAELVLATAEDKRIGTHIIDRTFVENGERWIIDYKSTHLGQDASDAALENEARQYRPQLERYAGLFAVEGLPVRKAIFFLAHGKMVELGLEPISVGSKP
jgi:ATP-dependent exoDNAse (exonuclease V) beta subunit